MTTNSRANKVNRAIFKLLGGQINHVKRVTWRGESYEQYELISPGETEGLDLYDCVLDTYIEDYYHDLAAAIAAGELLPGGIWRIASDGTSLLFQCLDNAQPPQWRPEVVTSRQAIAAVFCEAILQARGVVISKGGAEE